MSQEFIKLLQSEVNKLQIKHTEAEKSRNWDSMYEVQGTMRGLQEAINLATKQLGDKNVKKSLLADIRFWVQYLADRNLFNKIKRRKEKR